MISFPLRGIKPKDVHYLELKRVLRTIVRH